jgi:hypothetical protein
MHLHKNWAETKAEDLKKQTARRSTHDTSIFSSAVLEFSYRTSLKKTPWLKLHILKEMWGTQVQIFVSNANILYEILNTNSKC